ncbi:hypothetical protein SKAU_G00282250 [Synaphobranchus kaupii]|uniref:Uncharacterized protein n=1 Tax=Synaphobranchus kaupii TaxID=118154 RepID=A0A9Q1IN49_SYNKA|nr:hypothetical protein SKAU_G00282250 [Synaphobranchus kaupii]
MVARSLLESASPREGFRAPLGCAHRSAFPRQQNVLHCGLRCNRGHRLFLNHGCMTECHTGLPTRIENDATELSWSRTS